MFLELRRKGIADMDMRSSEHHVQDFNQKFDALVESTQSKVKYEDRENESSQKRSRMGEKFDADPSSREAHIVDTLGATIKGKLELYQSYVQEIDDLENSEAPEDHQRAEQLREKLDQKLRSNKVLTPEQAEQLLGLLEDRATEFFGHLSESSQEGLEAIRETLNRGRE